MYQIYKHQTPDGRVYIGCTSKTIKKRRQLGYTGEFGDIVRKLGWENIETTILATTDSQEESVVLEDLYIRKFNAANPEYGYNRAKAIGGKAKITIQRLSEAAYTAHSNPATHKKLCESQKIAQNRPEVRALKSKSSKAAMTKPGMHEKLSNSAKSAWSKPDVRQRFVDSHKGKKWVHRGSESKQVNPELITQYLGEGWELGRAYYKMPKRKK